MRPLVIKFGGTSVAAPARVRRAARRIRAHVRTGRPVVAVVSAAGDTTDRILAWAEALDAPEPDDRTLSFDAQTGRGRELDRALATGEDRSAALLAVALCRLGLAARSLRGGEAGILADGSAGAGRIVGVDAAELHRLLRAGIVPVVSGFQAVRADGETVTLGRGGSDTSAVAIAAALGADCDIVTDVDAVYDRDPRLDPGARAYAALDHQALVRITGHGARVVHPGAARLAADAGVPLRVYHHRAPLRGAGTTIGRTGSAAAPQGGAA